MLYLDTNNRDHLKFGRGASFFCKELTDNDLATDRAVSLQEVFDKIRRAQYLLMDAPVNYANATQEIHKLWEEIVEIVRPPVGASVEPTQNVPVIEAPTNSPSRKPSKKKE